MSFRYQYDDVTPNDNPYEFPEKEIVTGEVISRYPDGKLVVMDSQGYEYETEDKKVFEGQIVEGQIIKGKFIPL